MANHEKGEVALTVGDRTYTLVYDFDAICQVEKLLSDHEGRLVTFAECFEAAKQISLRHIRALIWGAFRRHQPNLTIQQAGELIEQAGGPLKMLEIVGALRRSGEPEAGEIRPPRSRRARNKKAGATTTSTRDASASVPKTSGG